MTKEKEDMLDEIITLIEENLEYEIEGGTGYGKPDVYGYIYDRSAIKKDLIKILSRIPKFEDYLLAERI